MARLVRGADAEPMREREFVPRGGRRWARRNRRIMFGPHPAQRRLADHRRHDAVGRRHHPVRIRSSASSASASSRRSPRWGNMLTNAQELIWTAPALAVWPGLLIFVTVIAFNFVGDGLQDAFNPKSRIH